MSKQTYRVYFCFRRKFRLKEAEVQEIKDLFEQYSENGMMDVDHLHIFLKDVQREDNLTREEAEAVMESILNEQNISYCKSLHTEEFLQYLLSDLNAPLPHPPKVRHDMNAPLSHYFIYSGHNSYLTGNQISSDCSEKPIIEALKRGVRVIELDMWPNSKKKDVHIMHGRTLTSPVKLIKCLRAIRKYAFIVSDYPVIITLEDHLNQDLQDKVAGMAFEIFGEDLVHVTSESLQEFPSPESLKWKVIISTKPPKEYLDSTMSKENEEDTDQYDQDKDDHSVNAAPEYKHLIAIRSEKMKGEIKEWLRVNSEKAHCVSLNEEKLKKAVVTHGAEIVRFNTRNLMRVYPKGTRIDCWNYNPLIGWSHGAQMVAFNMQGHGRSLWLMQGLFRANGGCGYVKKPDFLLKHDPNNEAFNPEKLLPVKTTLRVNVYMGRGWNLDFNRTHFDGYPPTFYVRIGIEGVRQDSIMRKTGIIEDDWTPVWNHVFEFPLTVPELALLRIEVHEYDMREGEFGGQTCLPVWELRTGIRAVPLHDYEGNKYKSAKLLVRFDFI